MSQNSVTISPFRIEFSINSIIEKLEDFVENNLSFYTLNEQELLSEIDQYSELRTGLTDIATIQAHSDIINDLVHSYFPSALSKNEIKAVTLPYTHVVLNPTERLEAILELAGAGFEIELSNFSEHQFYIMNCCLILKVMEVILWRCLIALNILLTSRIFTWQTPMAQVR